MVTALRIQEHVPFSADMRPRRPATIAALDARLSVWGQAAREASARRADALTEGVVQYVDRVGRNAESLQPVEVDGGKALLAMDPDCLVELAAQLAGPAVVQSCRLLWVDLDRLRERMGEALAPSIEGARVEVRRLQALYRRRARLWQNEQSRLDELRDEIESLRVPRCYEMTPDQVARGLLMKHRIDAGLTELPPCSAEEAGRIGLRVRPGSLSRWITQLDEQIERLSQDPIPLRAR